MAEKVDQSIPSFGELFGAPADEPMVVNPQDIAGKPLILIGYEPSSGFNNSERLDATYEDPKTGQRYIVWWSEKSTVFKQLDQHMTANGPLPINCIIRAYGKYWIMA